MNSLSTFEAYLTHQDKSPQTIRGYLSDLRIFVRWFEQSIGGEAFEPQSVTSSDVRTYRQYLLTVKCRKANTVNRHLMSIRSYLNWAIRQGLIEQNPAGLIKSVKQTPQAPRWLNKKEQHALQQAIEKDLQLAILRYPVRITTRQRDAAMVILLLNTGLGLSELLALHLEDIELSDRKGQLRVIGKGRKERVAPLNAEARKALHSWFNVRPTTTNNEVAFIALEQASNGNLSSRSTQRAVRRLGQDAGLPDLTPHILRHTFAKNLVDAGVSLEKVAALLGVGLTAVWHYAVVATKDLEAAVEKISSGGEHV